MMIKTIMVCDNCGKEQESQTAENWIDVRPVGRWDVAYDNESPPTDGRDLYCSETCLLEKTTAKMAEARRLIEHGVYKWRGFEYKLT